MLFVFHFLFSGKLYLQLTSPLCLLGIVGKRLLCCDSIREIERGMELEKGVGESGRKRDGERDRERGRERGTVRERGREGEGGREGERGRESNCNCVYVSTCAYLHIHVYAVCVRERGEINKSAYTFTIGLLLHNLNV